MIFVVFFEMVPLAPIIIITFEFYYIKSPRLELRAEAILSCSLLISFMDRNFYAPKMLSNLLAYLT